MGLSSLLVFYAFVDTVIRFFDTDLSERYHHFGEMR